MEKYIQVFINGQPFNCNYLISLKDLLIYLNLDFRSIIVEYNKEIVDQDNYHATIINNNDSIEIITIVGGG